MLTPRRYRLRRCSGWSEAGAARLRIRVGVLDALIDLIDSLVDEVDCLLPVAALVGLRLLQFVDRLLQMVPGIDHVNLNGVGGAGAQDSETCRRDDSGNHQPKLGNLHRERLSCARKSVVGL